MSQRVPGIVMVLVSGASFGAIGTFALTAYAAGVKPMTLLFLRFTFAGIFLLLVCGAQGKRLPSGRPLVLLILLGAVGYVGESLAYFYALTWAGPGLVSLLLYTFPAMVTLGAAVFFGEKLGASRLVALVLALGGTALTIGAVEGGSVNGVVLGLTSAVMYSGYILASSRVIKTVEPLVATAIISCSAAVVFGGLMGLEGVHLPRATSGWLAIGGLALLSTVVAIMLFFAGMKRVGPVIASMVSTIEPVVAVALAAIFLGERLTLSQHLGGALILGAVVWLARSQQRTAT